MTAPAPISVYKSFVGVALESTLGTGVYTPVSYFPISAAPTFTPYVELLEDKGFRGAPGDVFGVSAGVSHGSLAWGGDLFTDTIGYPLVGLLGEVAVTGTNPYTHTIDVLNSTNFQPPSYTTMYHYGMTNTKGIPGCMFDTLTIKFADGLCSYTTSVAGWTQTDQTKPTPSYSAVTPLRGWNGAVTIGGSTSVAMLDGEVTIKRNVNPLHPLTTGQDATSTWGGMVTVEGKMTLIMESNAELARYTTPAQAAVVWNVNETSSNRLQLTFTKAQYQQTGPAWDTSAGYVTLPVAFKAVWNTTDVGSSSGYSPMKAVLVNAVAGGSYK